MGSSKEKEDERRKSGRNTNIKGYCGAMQKPNIVETFLHILYRYDGSLDEISI